MDRVTKESVLSINNTPDSHEEELLGSEDKFAYLKQFATKNNTCER